MFVMQVTYFIDFFETPFVKDVKDKSGITSSELDKHYMNGFKFGLGLAVGF